MKKILILFLMFVATPAIANTANIACGDSKDCNDKSTAAQKCTELGYSLNKVENCEHYLKCPFDTQYQKCVKYPKVSCQSLGFTQTTPCGSNQKQLICTDSDGSVKYQCLDERSTLSCKEKGFTLNSDVQAGCDKLISCQDKKGWDVYKLCAEGHIASSYDRDTCDRPCYRESPDDIDCTDADEVGCVWGTDTDGYIRYQVIVNSSVFSKSNKSYDCYDGYCYGSGACYTFVQSKTDPIDPDCRCSPCGRTSFGEDPNFYYCDCDATFGRGDSGGGSSDDGATLCDCRAGDWLLADGTCDKSKSQPSDAIGKVYMFSGNAFEVVHTITSGKGCYVKAVALGTQTAGSLELKEGQCWRHDTSDEGYLIASSDNSGKANPNFQSKCVTLGSNASAYCYVPSAVDEKQLSTGLGDYNYYKSNTTLKVIVEDGVQKCSVTGSGTYYPHFIVRTSGSGWTSGDNGAFIVNQ